MILIDFDIDEKGHVTKLKLDSGNLTGYEKVSMLKDALEHMAVQNTARTFARKYRSGEYEDRFSEETLNEVAGISNLLADIWKYEPFAEDTDSHDLRPYMNPLHLLENALNFIVYQHEIILDYQEKNKYHNSPALT